MVARRVRGRCRNDSVALVDRWCPLYASRLPVNTFCWRPGAVAESGTSRKSRRITRARRGWDATKGSWIRGSSPLTDGSWSGMI